MYLSRARRSRFFRRSSSPAAAILGAAGLLLTACSSDAPTGVGPDAGGNIPALTLAAGAYDAATTSTHRIIRTLATLPLRNSLPANVASGGGHINSPYDVTYVGGPLVTSATSRNVYVNCASGPAKCWGSGSLSPATFLRDLNHSSFIGVVDQYLGEDAAGHFSVAELNAKVKLAGTPPTATLNDVFAIVFSASKSTNASGYKNIFHVFLPKGTDMCMDATHCYSPDNPSTFIFCAFHGSVDFGSSRHVLFTVEPYQAVAGCVIPGQTPHGVIDATASVLSHEFLETTTDPDLDAWFNLLTGMEIGDLCSAFGNNEPMGGHNYVIQEEYSNSVHNCSDGQ